MPDQNGTAADGIIAMAEHEIRALTRERDKLAGSLGRAQEKIDRQTERIKGLVVERDHALSVTKALNAALEVNNEVLGPLSAEVEELRRFKLATEALGSGTVKPANMGRTGNYLCLECRNEWFITAIVVREDGAQAGRLSVGTCNECGTDQVLAPKKEQPE